MPGASPPYLLRLPCPACHGMVEAPAQPDGGDAVCGHCAAPVPLPTLVAAPAEPMPVEDGASLTGKRRNLKVRTPAMPGSRASQPASKEPPRLPKPGDLPQTSSDPSLPAAPALQAAEGLPLPAPPMPAPATPATVLHDGLSGPASSGMAPAPRPATVPAVFLSPPRDLKPVPSAPLSPQSTSPGYRPAPPRRTAFQEVPSTAPQLTLLQRARLFVPLIGAALACSAAIAAWRVWPAALPFTDLSEPSPNLLYHYQPNARNAPATPTERGPDAYEEFAAEGFHFTAPTDYWERISGPASPFSLLQPAFTLRRSESSPPSEFGVGACDFAIAADVLPPGTGVNDNWETLPAVLAVQARFSCGLPDRYEISTPGPHPVRCLRLVWETLASGSGEPPRQLEMWIHQRGEVAWSMTGLMPGATSAYALTRTLQRLAGGFYPLPQEPELVRASLAGRDLVGTIPLESPPAPQPLYRWTQLPDDTSTWPNGRFLAPGAEGLWTVGNARIALATLPPDGLEKVAPSRILTALRQIWPALRGLAIPVLDPAETPVGQTIQLVLSGTFNEAPVQCALRYRASAEGIALAFAFQPTSAGTPAPDPTLLLENLDLTPGGETQPATPPRPSALHLPLLERLAVESHANGRPREAADFHLALFNRSQNLEDLASACYSLSNAGQADAATTLFDTGSQRFVHTPGWELYRILVLARLGSATRAHRDAMELLSAQRFPGSLAAPYLDALISSKSWSQAKAFASMLVRNDPDSPQWRLHYASILAETNERPKALSIIHATQETWTDDPILGIECVQTLLRLKAPQDAAILASRVTQAHPTQEQAWLILGQCHTLLGRQEEARMSYQNALKAAPSSKAARLALAALSSAAAQSDTAFLTSAIDPVPLPASLANSIPAIPADHHAPALILSRITGHRYQRGRPGSTTTRTRIYIANAEGMSQWNTLTIPINPSRERLTLHSLKVLQPNGKTLAEASRTERYTIDSPDGSKLLNFPVPALTPGCIIDYAITTESLLPATGWPFITHHFALPTPCLADICYVTGDLTNITWKHSAKQEPIRTPDALIWRQDPPAILSTASQETPTLCLGTVTESWETIGRHYLEQIRHRLHPDPAITEAANRFTLNCTTRAAKITVLARHVRADISYTAIEFGYRAIIPHAAATTLANRYGDCKDHAVLLHCLLNAAGIPSHLALIHSTTAPHPDFPALNQFDHMIVALPTAEGGFDFIDATDKFLEPTPGNAPSGLVSRPALILDPARPRLASTPDHMAPSTGTLVRLVTLQEESEDAQINDQLTLSGPAAATLRSQLSSVAPSGQAAAFRRLLALDRLQDELLSVNLTALRDPSQPLVIQLTSQSHGALRSGPEGPMLFLSHPLADYLLYPANLSEQAATGTLQLTTPVRLHLSLTAQGPAGPLLPPPPTRGRPPGPFGTWETRTSGNTLTWTAELPAGRWTGPDALTCARVPTEALLSLRRPWRPARGPVTENGPPQPPPPSGP